LAHAAENADHVLIFGEAHLRQVLKADPIYYNRVRIYLWTRPHRSFVLFSGSVTSPPGRSSVDFIISYCRM
jgi:hypothetical protein